MRPHVWFYKGELCKVISCRANDNVINELLIARLSNPDERILVRPDEDGVFPDLEYELAN